MIINLAIFAHNVPVLINRQEIAAVIDSDTVSEDR